MTVVVGQTATFNVTTTNNPAPNYKWQKSIDGGQNFTDISGATSSSYTTPATVLAENGTIFRVVVSIPSGALLHKQQRSFYVACWVSAQNSSYAGNGTTGFGGDGGSALAASLSFPGGVVMDGASNLYIADSGNHRIRKVGLNGIITTIAGTNVQGITGDRRTRPQRPNSSPNGLAMDAAGNLFMADGYGVIRKIDGKSGIITTIAGNASGMTGFSGDGGPATSAVFNTPIDVAVDGAGNIYIADSNNNRVRKINTSGIITTVAVAMVPSDFRETANPPPPPASVPPASRWTALGIFISPMILPTTTSRELIASAKSTAKASSPPSPATDRAAIPETAGSPPPPESIQIILRSITWEIFISLIPATIASEKWTPPRAKYQRMPVTASRDFSGDGGDATAANLNVPSGITTDIAGRLFFADTYNQRVRLVAILNLPQITTQPQNQTVTVGQTATFSVVATNSPNYKWQKSINGGQSFADISGATSASYTTPATVLADNATIFKVVVSNSVGTVTSQTATLVVTASNPPGTVQFVSAAASVNETAGTITLNVTRGSGSGGAISVHYQTMDGTAVAGSNYNGHFWNVELGEWRCRQQNDRSADHQQHFSTVGRRLHGRIVQSRWWSDYWN